MSSAAENQKQDRLFIRISSAEKLKIARAAQAEKVTRSQFILREALQAADRVLADQTRFSLSPEQWTEFCNRLDEPDRDLPNIRALVEKSRKARG